MALAKISRSGLLASEVLSGRASVNSPRSGSVERKNAADSVNWQKCHKWSSPEISTHVARQRTRPEDEILQKAREIHGDLHDAESRPQENGRLLRFVFEV